MAETVCVLAAFNVARAFGLLGPPLVAAAVLLSSTALIAALERVSWSDLGLRPGAVAAGLRWGLGAFAVVFLALLTASVLPTTNGFLHDSRAAIPGSRLAYELFVSTVLGTVLPEEFAFRGVLFGAARQAFGTRGAVVLTSALFGLWHIAPTLHTSSGNETVRHAPVALAVLGAVAITFVAGVVFCWLRLRSHSLVAPAIAHCATNGLALIFAWYAVH